MKIVVWGINYAPEQTGIAPYNTGLCEHLAAAGHDVRMLTTFAYYPAWKKADGDRGRLYRTDRVRGVPVHRCWHYVPAQPTASKRILHEASFVFTSWLRLLCLPRPDVMVVVSPPLLLGAAAWLAGLLKRRPYVFHVQDMQPDAAVMLGLLRPGKLTRLLYGLERFGYRRAALVSGITPGMLRMFTAKGLPPERQVLFPNWTATAAADIPARGAFRRRLGIGPETFLAVYSGNLGRKQGLDIVLGAAKELQAQPSTAGGAGIPEIRIVLAGDGVEKAALQEQVSRERLDDVMLLPLQPAAAYREMLADADVCLVTQQPGSGALFFPSKLLTILAHGRPVVAVADPGGELDRAIREGGFGWSVPPGRANDLAQALALAAGNAGERETRAARGLGWVREFEEGRVLAAFEATLREHFGHGIHPR